MLQTSIRQGSDLYVYWVEVFVVYKLFTIDTAREWFFQRAAARRNAMSAARDRWLEFLRSMQRMVGAGYVTPLACGNGDCG